MQNKDESVRDNGAIYSNQTAQVICLKSDLRRLVGVAREFCENMRFFASTNDWSEALVNTGKVENYVDSHFHLWLKSDWEDEVYPYILTDDGLTKLPCKAGYYQWWFRVQDEWNTGVVEIVEDTEGLGGWLVPNSDNVRMRFKTRKGLLLTEGLKTIFVPVFPPYEED